MYGRDAEKDKTKENAPTTPTGLYGVTKVFQEKIGSYFLHKNGVDVRIARIPASAGPYEYVSHNNFALFTHIFFDCLRNKKAIIPIQAKRVVPFCYMDDAIEGLIKLMNTPRDHLKKDLYNIQSFSINVQHLLDGIKKRHPHFQYEFKIDERDGNASDWPRSLDVSDAEMDWGWSPKVKTLDKFIDLMFESITEEQLEPVMESSDDDGMISDDYFTESVHHREHNSKHVHNKHNKH